MSTILFCVIINTVIEWLVNRSGFYYDVERLLYGDILLILLGCRVSKAILRKVRLHLHLPIQVYSLKKSRGSFKRIWRSNSLRGSEDETAGQLD